MNLNKESYSILVIFVFHLIGAVGLCIPDLRDYFLLLTPFNLLLTLFILIWNSSFNNLSKMLIIVVLGFVVELIGVKTEVLFGSYTYGTSLGYKLFDVPLIIGVNWLILVLGTKAIFQKYFDSKWVQIILGSTLMVLLDVLIEPVAIKLNFWQWENNVIPTQNFIMWFMVSLLMHWILSFKKTAIPYRLGLILIVSQAGFFSIINIF